MNGLESFRARINSPYTPRRTEDKVGMLKFLQQLKMLPVFEVKISWGARDTASLLKWRPFDLEGVEGEVVERSQGQSRLEPL